MVIVRLDEHGRLLVPSDLRGRLGLRKADAVTVELTDRGELTVRPLRDTLQCARGLFRAHRAADESVVDALLDARRAEATRERDGRQP